MVVEDGLAISLENGLGGHIGGVEECVSLRFWGCVLLSILLKDLKYKSQGEEGAAGRGLGLDSEDCLEKKRKQSVSGIPRAEGSN